MSHAMESHLEWNDFMTGGPKYGQDMNAVWGKRYGLEKHSTAREIINVVGENLWDEYFTFSFVRNPLSRMTSLYKWTLKRVRQWGWKRYARHIIKPSRWKLDFWDRPHVKAYLDTKSFSGFIRHPRLCESKMFKPQYEFLVREGKIDIDYVGKVESLQSDFAKICSHVGIEAELPHKNPSPSTSATEVYTRKDVRYIEREFESDYKAFGYTKT